MLQLHAVSVRSVGGNGQRIDPTDHKFKRIYFTLCQIKPSLCSVFPGRLEVIVFMGLHFKKSVWLKISLGVAHSWSAWIKYFYFIHRMIQHLSYRSLFDWYSNPSRIKLKGSKRLFVGVVWVHFLLDNFKTASDWCNIFFQGWFPFKAKSAFVRFGPSGRSSSSVSVAWSD